MRRRRARRRVHTGATQSGQISRGRGSLKAVFKVARVKVTDFKSEQNVRGGKRRSIRRKQEKKNEPRSKYNSSHMTAIESDWILLKAS